MNTYKPLDRTLKVLCAALLILALALTFTVSDYYIFNRFGEFNAAFILCQWIKKAGLLTLPLAVFYNNRSCADISKYILPLATVISLFTFGNFFEITAVSPDSSPADKVYASINEFIPQTANAFMYILSAMLYFAVSALLFVRDGFSVRLKSFVYLPLALVGCMPLNIFENFFDINAIPADSPLRFNNFTVWHALAIAILAGFTIGAYYFLRRKDTHSKNLWLAAAAIVMLIQYHSKDSMVMGDGYNVYHTVFACIPLFICNIGVYVAAISVLMRKRVLYAISFFVHAAGALTVFVYFGKPEMSNYGIFCSYSILYFCLTHCLLFALSVLPAALGIYKFRPKDAIVPLIYYCIVIITASVASALVTSASADFSYDGYRLAESELLMPNYAFTQINPLPFGVPPVLTITVWRYEINILYILGLYAAYVAIFYVFNGAYYAFLAVRAKVLGRAAKRAPEPAVVAEAAVTDEVENSER